MKDNKLINQVIALVFGVVLIMGGLTGLIFAKQVGLLVGGSSLNAWSDETKYEKFQNGTIDYATETVAYDTAVTEFASDVSYYSKVTSILGVIFSFIGALLLWGFAKDSGIIGRRENN
jgi:hypothetical protein